MAIYATISTHCTVRTQLLHTPGITREDLMKRSDKMPSQFLTADDAMGSRIFEHEGTRPRLGSDLQSNSKLAGSSQSLVHCLSRVSMSTLHETAPPMTLVKSDLEPPEILGPHWRMDSMEMIIERQRRQRKSRKGRERELSKNCHHPPLPSPSHAPLLGVKSTPVCDDPKMTYGNATPDLQKASTEVTE
jgi:DNA ligase-4